MWDTDLVIVSSHFHENLEWLEKSKYQVVVCTNNPSYHRTFINPLVNVDLDCRAKRNHGREASAYIRFIVRYYDQLPEYIAFLHGHEFAWHQHFPGTLFDAIKRAKKEEYDHVSLNLQYCLPDLKPGNPYWEAVLRVFPQHFEHIVGKSVPVHVECLDCSAQFIVNRKQILKYPKSVWEEWLDLTQNPARLSFKDFEKMPWVFEYSWHVIFGEEWEYNKDTYYDERFHPA